MFIAYAVVAIVLSLALVASGRLKLTHETRVVEGIGGLGVPLSWFPALALAEIAGALGLIIGLWVPAIGIAAGVGVVLYFIGAVATHVRAHDRGLVTPAVIGLVAAVTIALRIATL
jgi:hypothetical protein